MAEQRPIDLLEQAMRNVAWVAEIYAEHVAAGNAEQADQQYERLLLRIEEMRNAEDLVNEATGARFGEDRLPIRKPHSIRV